MTDSKYCYPGTNVLINIPGFKNEKELTMFERMVTSSRITELHSKPIAGSFDLEHMQKIHHHIFQDVYPFAGKIRDVDIAKPGTLFCKPAFIHDSARNIFSQLHQENLLKALPGEKFADRAAYYMADLNLLHPFREGNGRTLREFMRQLAKNAGHELDWSLVDKDRLLNASIQSVKDESELAKVIFDAINPNLLTDQNQRKIMDKDTLLLSDLIKKVDGMPSIHNKVVLDANVLNKEVSSYQLREGKHNILDVVLKENQEKLSIRMDPMPHVNQALKEKWIDFASRSFSESSISRYFGNEFE